jgi:uncharacterized protein with HEPN domain
LLSVRLLIYMNNRDFQILKKMLSEIIIIEEIIFDFDEERFKSDEITKRAACMTLINIGELVKNLTDEFRESYKRIPWKGIAGLRDITSHKYHTLKMGDVWTTLVYDIPNLKKELEKMLDINE